MSNGTLDFGAAGTPVLFNVVDGEITGTSGDKEQMAPFLNITGVASAAGYTITAINASAFEFCAVVTSVSIPSTVTSLGNTAFASCSGLTSVTIPNSVTSIGEYAFNSCSQLTTVTVGSGVTTIGASTFNDITTNARITFSCNNPPFENIFSEGVQLQLFYTSSSLTGWDTAISGYTATLATVPDAPTIGTATAGNGQATVTWTAPVNTEKPNITAYTVTSSPGGATATWSSGALTATVTGLTNGTAYTFTVKATNAAGDSSASAASNSVTPATPATVPDAPTIGTATAGNGQATVTWVAPTNDGGATITAYTVTSSPGGATATWSSGALTATVTGLTNGTYYTFTVKATNSAGDSLPSDPSNSTMFGTLNFGAAATGVGSAVFNVVNGVITGFASGTKTNMLVFLDITGKASAAGFTITAIGANAFTGCTKPTSVSIPDTVTTIEDGAFNGCSKLTSVVIPSSVTSIGTNAFTGCSLLATVTVGSGVTTIGAGAFTTISTSARITFSCNNNSFADLFTTGLSLQLFYISSSLTGWANPISGYTATLATVPDAPTIGTATAGAGQATVTWTAPANNGGAVITAYTITSSPGNYTATWSSGALSAIVSGLTNGTAYTFTVKATNAVGDSLASAASNSAVYKTLDFGAAGTPVLFSVLSGTITALVSGTKAQMASFLDISGVASAAGVTVTAIGTSAFQACAAVTSVSIPTSVTTLGDNALAACTELTSVMIPNSVTSIGQGAFQSCSKLTSATLSTSLAIIPQYTFKNCSKLTSVTIPTSVTTLGSAVFQNCTELTSVVIPSSVTSIGTSVFYLCSKLTSVTILSSLTSIPNNTFDSCSGLTSFTIPTSVTSIGNGAFFGCSKLTSIAIPTSVTSIGNTAFNSCSLLAVVTIGSRVTAIGAGAFVSISNTAQITFSCNNNSFAGIFTASGTAGVSLELFYTSSSLTGWANPISGYTATLATVPDAPTIGTATAGDGQATVTWSAPANDGGPNISAYTVTSSPGGATATWSSGALSATVTGLTNGTAYTFTVKATNAVGDSSASAASNSVTHATVPNAPTIGTATAGNGQAVVTWTAPANNGGATITAYTVTSSPGGYTATWSSGALSATVTGLTNGTAYTFAVKATNSAGDSNESAASDSVTPVTVPDAPTIGSATDGNGQATVTWSAPASNGGAAITSYTVTSSPGNYTATWTSGDLTATVIGLTNGTAYTFTVKATNSAGDSNESAASDSVTPATTPDAPTIGTATAGNGQATVTWSAPANDGGPDITSYTITSSSGGYTATWTSGELTATVTGLSNGTAYTFTVKATNSEGNSSESTASNSVTPLSVPGAPTIGTATAGAGQATVTWSAPANNGGATITAYTVTSTPGNYTATWSSGALSATVTGLTNGTAYTFKVKAANSQGDSSESAASDSVTPLSVPGAPTIGTATAGAGQATVTWSAPASNGGATITAYTVTSTPGNYTATWSSGALSATVTGLTNGTAYTFKVKATNSQGDSLESAASDSVTPVTAPGNPTNLVISGTTGRTRTLTFTAPTNTGGSAIGGYYVFAADDTVFATALFNNGGGTGTSITMSDLPTGTTNYVLVAQNEEHPDYSTGVAFETSVTIVPSWADSTVSWALSGTTATVTFTAANDGGSAITHYKVYDADAEEFVASNSGAVEPLEVTGLTNGTTYNFVMVAENVAGDSTDGPSTTVTPVSAPGVPILTAPFTTTSTTIVVEWTNGALNGNDSIVNNVILCNINGTALTTYSNVSSPYTVTVAAGSTNYIKVSALGNIVATTVYSNIVSAQGYITASIAVAQGAVNGDTTYFTTYLADAPSSTESVVSLRGAIKSLTDSSARGTSKRMAIEALSAKYGSSVEMSSGASGTATLLSTFDSVVSPAPSSSLPTSVILPTYTLSGGNYVAAYTISDAEAAAITNGTKYVMYELPISADGDTYTLTLTRGAASVSLTYNGTVLSDGTTTYSAGDTLVIGTLSIPLIGLGSLAGGGGGGEGGGGGGAGDPYVTTFSNISYKLPTMNAPIRYFQTMDCGKLLTINAQLKTLENSELADDTLRSLIVLRKKMTTKQYANIIEKLMKPETLCFFERVSIQYGEQRLVVNLWNSKFEVVENTLRCAVEKVERVDLLKKSGGIYDKYAADTVKLTLGTTAIYLSTYNTPLVRNGIYVDSGAVKGANGVVVNALSASAMTLQSLASVEPVSTRDSLRAVTKVETFVDHEGVRTRNVVTYK